MTRPNIFEDKLASTTTRLRHVATSVLLFSSVAAAQAPPAADAPPLTLATEQPAPNQPPTDQPVADQAVNDQTYRLPELPDAAEPSSALSTEQQLYVRGIRVDGVTAFDLATIAAVVTPYENRLVSSAELQSLRVALTRLYIDRGYINSGVLLPDQQVTNGIVEFRALEGKLSRIDVDGRSKLAERYVSSRVQQYLQGPLSLTDLQVALRYLQQDVNVRRLDARLDPGEEPGESVLALHLDDAPRFQIGLSYDNHRASSTGATNGTLLLGARNLTGYGEELRASQAISDGADQRSVFFSVPLSARNASIQTYYSRSDADIIERRFRSLDIQSATHTSGATLTLPFTKPGDENFALVLGFESKDSATKLLGVPFSFSAGDRDGKARTSDALLGVDSSSRTPNSVYSARLTYRRGLDAFGATTFKPRTADDRQQNPLGVDGRFDLVQAQATYVRRFTDVRWLAPSTQFVARATGQYSWDPLLSLEKMAIGGANTVRGFPENLLVRDNGLAATLELQIPLFGHTETHPLNLSLVPFIDYGRSWDTKDTDPQSDVRNTHDARYIASSGAGLRWNPLQGLQAEVFWGSPIADNFKGDDPRDLRQHDLQDDGVHFSVSYLARW